MESISRGGAAGALLKVNGRHQAGACSHHASSAVGVSTRALMIVSAILLACKVGSASGVSESRDPRSTESW